MTVDLRVSGVHLDHRDARNSVSDIRGCQKRCKNYLFIANWEGSDVWCVLTNCVNVSRLVVCRSFAEANRGAIPQHSERQPGGDSVPTTNAQNSGPEQISLECLMDGRREVATPAKFCIWSRSVYLRLAAKPTSGPGFGNSEYLARFGRRT